MVIKTLISTLNKSFVKSFTARKRSQVLAFDYINSILDENANTESYR